MIKAFYILFLTCASFAAQAQELSEWQGKWELGRYWDGAGGSLIISDCQKDKCHFEIGTVNGAHTCSVEGEISISDNQAIFEEEVDFGEGEEKRKTQIAMTLDRTKNIITVQNKSGNNVYCGMRGFFDGEYENEKNPYRYQTSFDCWAQDLSVAKKVICSSKELASLDKEYVLLFNRQADDKSLNKCADDKACLKDFYLSQIKSKFSKDGKIDMFSYVQQFKKPYFSPTDFALLRNYLQKNMSAVDNEAWQVSLSDVYHQECQDCFMLDFGAPGLYTEYESAFYLDAAEMWLAFVSANLKDSSQIIVYTNSNSQNMPKGISEWIDEQKKYHRGKIIIKKLPTSALID